MLAVSSTRWSAIDRLNFYLDSNCKLYAWMNLFVIDEHWAYCRTLQIPWAVRSVCPAAAVYLFFLVFQNVSRYETKVRMHWKWCECVCYSIWLLATVRDDTCYIACSFCGVHLETNKWTAEFEASESRMQTLAHSLFHWQTFSYLNSVECIHKTCAKRVFIYKFVFCSPCLRSTFCDCHCRLSLEWLKEFSLVFSIIIWME